MELINKLLPNVGEKPLNSSPPSSDAPGKPGDIHRKACEGIYIAARTARGVTSWPSADDLQSVAERWSRGLSDVPAGRLNDVLDLALKNYTDSSVPFGLPQLIAAWVEIMARERPSHTVNVPSAWKCEHEYCEEPRDSNDPKGVTGWNVCGLCGHTIPLREKKPSAQVIPLEAPCKG